MRQHPSLPATVFPPSSADTEGARFLQTVGVLTRTLWLPGHGQDSGRLPLVQDFEAASK